MSSQKTGFESIVHHQSYFSHFLICPFFFAFSLYFVTSYQAMSSIATQSLFTRFLNSPAGPKTIHFWAPTFKWVRRKFTREIDETGFNMKTIGSCYCWFE